MKSETWKSEAAKKIVPEGLWVRCLGCGETVFRKTLEANLAVCPKCDHHHRVSARTRIEQLIDPGSFEPFNADLMAADPLEFTDIKAYTDRIAIARKKSGENDGIRTGVGFIKGRKIVLGALDFTFLGGSMGSVVGEKIALAVEYATNHDLPLAIISCSGGARMQEALMSLMQMAKTAAALEKLKAVL